jgi:hypothetical protein
VIKLWTAASAPSFRQPQLYFERGQHARDTTAGTAAACTAALHPATTSCHDHCPDLQCFMHASNWEALSGSYAAVLTSRQPLVCCSTDHPCTRPSTSPGYMMTDTPQADAVQTAASCAVTQLTSFVCETPVVCWKGTVTSGSSSSSQ